MGLWQEGGFNAGLVMATCIGLWLFTRVLIPDVMLTFTITLAMWSFLRLPMRKNGIADCGHGCFSQVLVLACC